MISGCVTVALGVIVLTCGIPHYWSALDLIDKGF